MKRMRLGMAIVLGLSMAGSVTAAGSGNLRYSISVSKFENKAGWSGQWDIGNAFGEIMTAALQESGKFIVLGEKDMRGEAMAEQDLANSGRMAGGKKAPKTGQMTPAQLLVKGAVTHVQDSTTGGGGGVNFAGFRVGGSGDKAEVNITIYIIDTTTGQVKAQSKVVGKAGRKGLNLGYSGSSFGGDVAGFKKDNVGKATEDAVGQAVQFLEKQLEKIPWEGTVIKGGDKVTINRGSREGVSVGQVFTVGAVETLTDKDTGEALDTEMKQAGKIKVTSVKEKISYCEVLDGKDKIKPDMTIQPAD
jgi:curli biogenesis system outer membrane secretion channel CsgG